VDRSRLLADGEVSNVHGALRRWQLASRQDPAGTFPDFMAESSRPLFSIVTVTLNPDAALQRTVDSVGRQTFGDFEHVIKDGGSSDGSIERLRAPHAPRIVVRSDSGIYDGINQAIGLCRGRFVQFLNAGDTLAGPHVLAEVARAVERHPKCELFYCDDLNARRGLRSRVPERATPFFLYRRPICHQAWFVAAECLARVGPFDTRYRFCADHDFFVRAVVANRIAALRVPVLGVVYQGGGASDTSASIGAVLREYGDIRARYYSRGERLAYGCAVALTAPGVRRRIQSGPLGPLYVALLNAWRRPTP
jgi:glycosyltransferase involved in cell wall biosynthesis